jgi:hypothetical protein
MWIETKNSIAELTVKTAHDAQDDDQNRDAERHAQDGNQSDD